MGFWGCQRAQICSLTVLHISHPYPYLVSLSFYTILIIMPLCKHNQSLRVTDIYILTKFHYCIYVGFFKLVMGVEYLKKNK